MAANSINANVVLLAAATVTANQTIQAAIGTNQPLTNPLHKGVKVVVVITGTPGGTTPTLVVTIRGRDPLSGASYTILASATLNAAGTTVLTVYPGLTASANVSANDVLPATWDVTLTVGGTTPSFAVSVGASMLA